MQIGYSYGCRRVCATARDNAKEQDNDEGQCVLQQTMRRLADAHEDVRGTIWIVRRVLQQHSLPVSRTEINGRLSSVQATQMLPSRSGLNEISRSWSRYRGHQDDTWFADVPIAVRLVSQAPRGLNESPAADPRRAPETILCGDTHIRSREAESVRGLPGHRRERPRRHRRTHRLVEC